MNEMERKEYLHNDEINHKTTIDLINYLVSDVILKLRKSHVQNRWGLTRWGTYDWLEFYETTYNFIVCVSMTNYYLEGIAFNGYMYEVEDSVDGFKVVNYQPLKDWLDGLEKDECDRDEDINWREDVFVVGMDGWFLNLSSIKEIDDGSFKITLL